jgi:hypothetical protein
MADLVCLVLTLTFFLLAGLYVAGCERLRVKGDR